MSPLSACAIFLASAPCFRIKAQSSTSAGSQRSGTSTPPWDAALSDSALQAENEANVTNTLDSLLDMSEQYLAPSDFTIDSDFSLPPTAATADKAQTIFASKNPNLHYHPHPRIDGEIRFILNISFAHFVDHWQENLVNRMATI